MAGLLRYLYCIYYRYLDTRLCTYSQAYSDPQSKLLSAASSRYLSRYFGTWVMEGGNLN